MGLYSRVIFPRLLDLSMSSKSMTAYRQQLLADVSGNVLEIGFGTGLNLPHYPDTVQALTTVEPNEGMGAIAQKRIDASPIKVNTTLLNGEALSLPDESFDSIVCTWTLCSIPNAKKALGEAYRVLKPGGKFFFIEHGLSNEQTIQTWQNRITPIQRIIADGCHLNRKIDRLVAEAFDEVTVEEFYADDLPKIEGYFYRGVAIKAA
ncbi:class I SAM-dependent methyltransferase [cf. Phormidesmis sp. LEGE 11477]|uniref:class I SAM-dependent methyltransferase n=1 Tax=cf. Phormidesmis sp. LEGE 11477 TaxID=1828680 RepID=UPI00187F0C6D|nr:class I SAM-dependent methyltransferase [cf. Phormidesmis sp. LEGE 11477]MBE9063340.1 class I SAM-dependent methyltransferase [cf. Phormidesmis sp. LEGE 11477]